jgi:hypothetical protein
MVPAISEFREYFEIVHASSTHTIRDPVAALHDHQTDMTDPPKLKRKVSIYCNWWQTLALTFR